MVPICLVVGTAMTRVDLSNPDDISSMIQVSVRCSVPWLYLAFASSSIQALFPSPFGRWLIRNRRYIGLSFAGGMAWQLFFILWMVIGYNDYYANEVFVDIDLLIQVLGYMSLTAMTVTSFMPVRRKMSPRQWRTLHIVSIYYLWGVVWSTYWYELYYYDEINPIDYFYYWAGFVVWGLRVATWSKRRLRLAANRGNRATA